MNFDENCYTYDQDLTDFFLEYNVDKIEEII